VHSSSCERCCDDGGKAGRQSSTCARFNLRNFTAINKEPAAREVGVSVTNGAQEPRAGIWESLGSLGTGDRNPEESQLENGKYLAPKNQKRKRMRKRKAESGSTLNST